VPLWIVIMVLGVAGMAFVFLQAKKKDESETLKKVEGKRTEVRTKADLVSRKKTDLDIWMEGQDVKLTPVTDESTPVLISRDEKIRRGLAIIAMREQAINDALAEEIAKEEEPGIKINGGKIVVLREDAARLAAIRIRMAEARTPAEKSRALADFRVIREDAAQRIAEREGISYYEALKRMGVNVPTKASNN